MWLLECLIFEPQIIETQFLPHSRRCAPITKPNR